MEPLVLLAKCNVAEYEIAERKKKVDRLGFIFKELQQKIKMILKVWKTCFDIRMNHYD